MSTSTHNQALSALLFLYREVLNMDLPWMDSIDRLTKGNKDRAVVMPRSLMPAMRMQLLSARALRETDRQA